MFSFRPRLSLLLALGLAVWGFACSDDDSSGPGPNPPEACGDGAGIICTWAGTGHAGFNGDGKAILESNLYWPIDLTFTPSGRTIVLDWNNHRVREVLDNGTFETIMGTDFLGDGPDDLSDLNPPGARGTEINLNHPTHVLELPDGKLLVTAWHNHKLRVWDPATKNAIVLVGRGAGFAGDGGTLAELRLNQPLQTQIGPDDALYVLDQRNQRVRRIDLAAGTSSTVVGSGTAGFGGDGGPPLEAQMRQPAGGNPPPGGSIAFDHDGRLYITDVLNNRIRQVDFAANMITTFAGTGEAGYGGDNGPATAAKLNNPRDLEVSPDGQYLYVADELNNRVRRINIASGVITTFAGTGVAAFSGDGGQAAQAELNRPTGLAFDLNGDLFIADSYNHRIRRVNF